MSKKVILAATFAALTASAASAATVYTDRSTFEAASSVLTTETFDGFTSDVSLAATTFDVGDFSIATTLNSVLRIDSDGVDSQSVNGSAFVRGVGSVGDTFSYIFDTAITAFGVDLFGFNDSFLRSEVLIDGSTYALPVFGSPQNSFFGFTSATAFTTVTFSTLQPEDGGFDNVSYGVAAVPVPAAGLLLLTGFGALGAMARRRKS